MKDVFIEGPMIIRPYELVEDEWWMYMASILCSEVPQPCNDNEPVVTPVKRGDTGIKILTAYLLASGVGLPLLVLFMIFQS